MGEEHFGYSYRELNWRYVSGDPFSNNHSDWRYRYNAMGEREQKRLYHAPLPDSIAGQPYPWVHYLLGGSKDQLAVWHGQQMTSPFCDTVKFRNVFLYPTEYITHGVEYNGVREDIGQLVTRPDGSKQLRFLDHLASVRASMVIGVSGMSFADYDPWGNLLLGSSEDRRSFNSRERDTESGTYNNGVRKYEEGRFLSVDPLWSKFGSWSPYVYCYANPLTVTDPQGMQGVEIAVGVGVGVVSTPASWPFAAGVGGAIVLGADAAARTKMPALSGMPAGGALGVYIGLTLATEIYSGESGGEGSGGSGSSGSSGGGSTPPSGGGGGLGAGLGTGALGGMAAKKLDQLDFEKLQALVRDGSKAMNEFFKSGGKTVPDKAVLETYKELTVRILNGTGGVPTRKASETAIKVQTERLEMINKALKEIE